jgi:acyl-CoA synthetase (NDP forming)
LKISHKGSGLDTFFAPRSIAVVGASQEYGRVGGRALSVMKANGYPNPIYPIHPSAAIIQDLPAYARLGDAPGEIDLAILCLAADRIPDAIRECGRAGVAAALVFADGFGVPERKQALLDSLREARELSGLRLIGPNTVGIRRVDTRAFATFAIDNEVRRPAGGIATIAQSGALSVYFGSTLLRQRDLDARYVIDTGGEFDVDIAECIDYVSDDDGVSCISVVMEGCRDGDRLLRSVSKAVSRDKTVVFLKTGRSQAAQKQVASHTGSLAGSAGIYDVALAAAGAIVVQNEMELMDSVLIAGARRVPEGRRLGVASPSGGYVIMTVDAAADRGMDIPEAAIPPTDDEQSQLRMGSFANPIDYSSTVSAGANAMQTALLWMASQPNVDAVLLWQAYSAVLPDRHAQLAAAFEALRKTNQKPVFVCGYTSAELRREFLRYGVVCFDEPTRLVQALDVVTRSKAMVSPAPQARDAKPASAERVVAGSAARAVLGGLKSLPHVESVIVRTLAQAEAAQARWGGKVIMKVEADDLAHKTEFNLVSGPVGARELGETYTELIAARTKAGLPDAPIVLQPFEKGVELALGAMIDPVFGPTVMVATGGIFLEVVKDAAFACAPVSVDAAERMLLGLKGAPLLQGARGKPAVDIRAAAAALADLSQFAAAHRNEYAEIDINPLIVKQRGVVAVDALLVRQAPHET